MDIDIQQLRLLAVLAEEGNLTRAADKLFMSQSAASHILAKLRQRLDDPLFVKTRMGMEPSPLTLSLLPDLQKGLNSIEMALSRAKPFNPVLDAKTFNVAAVDYFEFFALPQLVPVLEKEAPNVRIAIEILPEKRQRERLESGDIDMIISVDQPSTVPKYYQRYDWLDDPLVGIVAEASHLPETLTLKQFLETPHIHLPNASTDPIDDWLLQHHQARQIAMIVQSYAIGGMVTAKSSYLMCVPSRIATSLLTMLPLRQVALPDGVPPLKLSLTTHHRFDNQDSVQWLIRQILTLK
ncbi:LysR family transcriptional regulator [Marinomonas mediterranea]|uniref:LysR family transcriptional regulator n=1 Tax=Marinomonas mediterranea TaxID=119864 RepID=UPI00234B6692|nr:LysR family transcriptional regulator [Marinomonas mediterranea]WCN14974.1 LysR family transcriptional regulator [Marinomonas mediterranea]